MGNDIVNYRPSWQVLRVSTMSEYSPYGGMTTPDGAVDGLTRLFNYVNDSLPTARTVPQYVQDEISRMGNTLEIEYACRVYRVRNFLVATINGLISDPMKQGHISKIREYEEELSDKINLDLVEKAADKWNWDVVRYELETLWRQDRMWFMAVREDMNERVEDKGKTAANMYDFIGIMDEVNRVG